jgi:hypothetical protein
MELKTSDEYVRYLFINQLNNHQIKCIENLYKGFMYFMEHYYLFSLITKLPLLYYVKLIMHDVNFNQNFDFKVINSFSTEIENNHINIIKQQISNLSNEEKLIFSYNITGSYYYNDTIDIILEYPIEIVTKQFVYDEKIVIEEETTHETNNVIIDLVNPNLYNICRQYSISTCNAELFIEIPFIGNTYDQIKDFFKKIIEFLIVRDNTLVN